MTDKVPSTARLLFVGTFLCSFTACSGPSPITIGKGGDAKTDKMADSDAYALRPVEYQADGINCEASTLTLRISKHDGGAEVVESNEFVPWSSDRRVASGKLIFTSTGKHIVRLLCGPKPSAKTELVVKCPEHPSTKEEWELALSEKPSCVSKEYACDNLNRFALIKNSSLTEKQELADEIFRAHRYDSLFYLDKFVDGHKHRLDCPGSAPPEPFKKWTRRIDVEKTMDALRTR